MSLEPNPRRSDYVGDGSTDIYDYDFPISDKSELLVKTLDTDYVETELVLDTDYSVQGVDDEDGGTITLLLGDLDLDVILAVIGRRPIEQQNNIGNQGSFRPDIIEAEFDKLTIVDQEQQEQIDRSVKLPDTVKATSFNPTLPFSILDPANAGCVVVINDSNDGFEIGPSIGDIEGASASAADAIAAAAAAAASEAVAVAAAVQATESAADAASFSEQVGGIEEVDTSGGNVPKTLPLASDGLAFVTYINKSFASAFAVIVSPTGPNLVHGQASDTLNAGEVGKYWSNGVDAWYKIN